MTSIEWTEATWNPIAGCSVLSPGCTNCYAMRTAARLARIETTAPTYAGLTQPSKAGPVWTGKIAINEKAMLEPLRRRKPTMYFVNSMSDLFHETVPDVVIDRVFAVMALTPQHTFQVLTKRSARMREYFAALKVGTGYRPYVHRLGWKNRDPRDGDKVLLLGDAQSWPLTNVWLGVSVEDQKRADERIPDLLATPAAVRFLSCEPLLGPVDLTMIDTTASERDCAEPSGLIALDALTGVHRDAEDSIEGVFGNPDPRIDWVIVGGESGPGARPMHPDWARSLRDQCAAAGVPFFFKQWGSWAPHPKDELITVQQYYRSIRYIDVDTGQRKNDPTRTSDATMRCIGKKRAGRQLDGVTHDAMPQVHRRG